jgi:hypothetical protein
VQEWHKNAFFFFFFFCSEQGNLITVGNCTRIYKYSHRKLVIKALCSKPQGRGFETRWGEWIFSIYLILLAALSPGIQSAHSPAFHDTIAWRQAKICITRFKRFICLLWEYVQFLRVSFMFTLSRRFSYHHHHHRNHQLLAVKVLNPFSLLQFRSSGIGS